jgi:hypothetical protein
LIGLARLKWPYETEEIKKVTVFYLILFHIREAMTEWVEERQEFANESRNFDSLFHALRVQERAFDEIM